MPLPCFQRVSGSLSFDGSNCVTIYPQRDDHRVATFPSLWISCQSLPFGVRIKITTFVHVHPPLVFPIHCCVLDTLINHHFFPVTLASSFVLTRYLSKNSFNPSLPAPLYVCAFSYDSHILINLMLLQIHLHFLL